VYRCGSQALTLGSHALPFNLLLLLLLLLLSPLVLVLLL
jgi:hypothetical protein